MGNQDRASERRKEVRRKSSDRRQGTDGAPTVADRRSGGETGDADKSEDRRQEDRRTR